MTTTTPPGALPASKEAEVVAEQWRALEYGEPVTSWKDLELGDRFGWQALANRSPDKYAIERRHLYAHPPTDAGVSEAVGASTIWRTMESAPKDGRNVLLCFHHHPVAIGRFEYNSWTYAFCVTEGGDSPTGWMPVPEKDRPNIAAEYTEGAALSTAIPAGDGVPPGMVLVPQVALDWLFGEGPDEDGHWFGDGNFSTKGAYWWRIPFRAMLSTASTAVKG